MNKISPMLAPALFFALMLAVGGALAGGEGCPGKGSKGDDGGTAAVTGPFKPLA